MNKDELIKVLMDIGGAATRITGDRNNHMIAIGILNSCEQTIEKLQEKNDDDKNTDNA